MVTTSHRAHPVPALIRRNTLLLAATQAFVGTGTQLMPTLGGIMVERLLGSMALAGLGSSLLYAARLLIAYPIGWIVDTLGRKAGLVFGLLLTLAGAVVLGLSILASSFAIFLAGATLFGFGVGAGQQLRTAAADMYLPERRAEGLGYVLTGSLIGALGGPAIITAAEAWSPALRIEPTSLAWLLVPAVIVPSIALVFLIHPDPKTIAADLGRFYPGYTPAPSEEGAALPTGAGVRRWLAHYPLRVGFVAMFVAHGVMVMMMALTPLVMAHRGDALTAISLAVSLHVVGMYGLSFPFGWLTDRIGRRSVILGGLAVVAVGAVMVPLSSDHWLATAGLVLVGLGWSGVNVAVTALVADTVPALERGRAVGVVDSFAGLASVTLPLAGGPLADVFGFGVLAVIAVALTAIAMLFAVRLAEPVPGRYAHALPA